MYEWNLHQSAAFQESIMMMEVILRNAIDERLRPWNIAQSKNVHNPNATFTDEWIEFPALPLHGLIKTGYANAEKYARTARAVRHKSHPRKTAPISHDDLLSQLSFGTWPNLLPHPDYPSSNKPKLRLWEEAIVFAFPHAPSGTGGIKAMCGAIKRLHSLRNRVAHGEPLLEVNVNARFGDILRVLASIDQDLADWCVDVSRVREVLKHRPTSP